MAIVDINWNPSRKELKAFSLLLIVSNIVLALVFYGVVWPIGILARLTGRNALQLGFDRDAKTYWNTRQPVKDPRRYFRQY